MSDRLSRLTKTIQEQPTPSRKVNLKKKSIKVDPKYDEYLSVILEKGPDVQDEFTLYLFSDDKNEILDQKILDAYPNVNFTFYHPEDYKDVNSKEVEVTGPITNPLSFSKHYYLVMHLTTLEFTEQVKSLFSIKNSRVLIFQELEDITYEEMAGLSSLAPEKKVVTDSYLLLNPNIRISAAGTSRTQEVVTEPVRERKPELEKEKVVDFVFPLPDNTGLPSRPDAPVDSPEFKKAFMAYIRILLERILFNQNVDENVKRQMLDNMTLPTAQNKHIDPYFIWRLAFTHDSENPDSQGNLQQGEKIGDQVSKLAFQSYTIERYPRISEAELSEISSRYQSEEYQVIIGKHFNFLEWLICDPIITPSDKLNEDLLEAFCGAIMTVGDRIKGGYGYILVRYFISGIFSNFDYDMSLAHGKPYTIVSQGYESNGWGRNWTEAYSARDNHGVWTVEINLTERGFVDFVREERRRKGLHDLAGFTGIRVSVSTRGKDEAKDEAANEVLKKLAEIKIYVEDIKNKDIIHEKDYRLNPEYRELADKALKKARENGFANLYFKEPTNVSKAYTYVMLVGEREGEEKIREKIGNVMRANPDPTSKLMLRKKLLANYLERP